MARKPMNGTRKNVTLSDSTNDRILAIRTVAELPSESEVIRRAIKLYSDTIKWQATGRNLYVKDGGEYHKVSKSFEKSALRNADEATLMALDIDIEKLAKKLRPRVSS